jgi:hydroxymethylpyrimidine pyrophosphatase-like HAD family hydrolase
MPIKRLVTDCCLIAADIDKTILNQSDEISEERKNFLSHTAIELINSAKLGLNIAVMTGNSLHELSARFFYYLIEQLCFIHQLELIDKFHFFCNSGGIYIHLYKDDETIKNLIEKNRKNSISRHNVIKKFSYKNKNSQNRSKLTIHPKYIDTSYLKRTAIKEEDSKIIHEILVEVSNIYHKSLIKKEEYIKRKYWVNSKENLATSDNQSIKKTMYPLYDKEGKIKRQIVELRPVIYGHHKPFKTSSVQITLKPILSFRHAKEPKKVFGNDFRTEIVEKIQERLDATGLPHYVARPGGRSSIDITLEKVDKAYALEFLIDHLNIRGSQRMGLEYGSNAIYLGDEVIAGSGNDYVVTRIPGLLVFAVNEDKDLIPSSSNIFVPSTIFDGPEAVAEVLSDINKIASKLIRKYEKTKKINYQKAKPAIEILKKRIFIKRIKDKIESLDDISANNLQILHTLVTLMCRDDESSKKWLAILINEFNDIMTHLNMSSKNKTSIIPNAIGTSHEDN